MCWKLTAGAVVSHPLCTAPSPGWDTSTVPSTLSSTPLSTLSFAKPSSRSCTAESRRDEKRQLSWKKKKELRWERGEEKVKLKKSGGSFDTLEEGDETMHMEDFWVKVVRASYVKIRDKWNVTSSSDRAEERETMWYIKNENRYVTTRWSQKWSPECETSKRQLHETHTSRRYLCIYSLKRIEDLSTATRHMWDSLRRDSFFQFIQRLDLCQTLAVIFSCNLDKQHLVICSYVLIVLRGLELVKEEKKKDPASNFYFYSHAQDFHHFSHFLTTNWSYMKRIELLIWWLMACSKSADSEESFHPM